MPSTEPARAGRWSCLSLLVLLALLGCGPGQPEAPPETAALVAFHPKRVRIREVVVVRFEQRYGEGAAGRELAPDLFVLDPPAEGRTTWITPTALAFQPADALRPGPCRARVAVGRLAGLSDSLAVFEFDLEVIAPTFEIQVDEPRFLNPADARWMAVEGRALFSDRPPDALLEGLVSLRWQGRQRVLPFEDAGTDEQGRHRYRFRADSLRRQETSTEAVFAWDGRPKGLEEHGERALTVAGLDRFRLLGASPDLEDGPRLVLRFSDPLDPDQAFDGLVSLDGRAVDRVQAQGAELVLYPRSVDGRTAALRVEGAILSVFGRRLGDADVRNVLLAAPEPDLRFADTRVVLPHGDSLLLPVETLGLGGLVAVATRVQPENVPYLLQQGGFDYWSRYPTFGRVVWWQEFPLEIDREAALRWSRHALDLSPLTRKEEPGLYAIEIFALPEHGRYPCSGAGAGSGVAGARSGRDKASLDALLLSLHEPDAPWSDREDPCAAGYYLNRWDGEPRLSRHRAALVSNIGLIAHRGTGSRVHVAVTELALGRPLSGARVTLYNHQREVLASGLSDGTGRLALDWDPARIQSPSPGWDEEADPDRGLLLVAEKGGDLSYLRLDGNLALDRSRADVGGRRRQDGLDALLATERGVWRPGDSIYVSAMLDDPGGRLPLEHPLTATLKSPDGRARATQQRRRDGGGLAVFRFATEPDAPTGWWTLELEAGGSSFERKLSVEAVRPNRLKVELELDPAEPRAGADARLKIHADWLHGAPARGLEAEAEIRVSDLATPFPRWSEYAFADPLRAGSRDTRPLGEGTLDDGGDLELRLEDFAGSAAAGPLAATVTALVHEPGAGFSRRYARTRIHPYARYAGVGLPPLNRWKAAATGREQAFPLLLVDPDGEPVQGVDTLTVRLYRIDWRWWWERGADGVARFLRDRGTRPVRTEPVVLENGRGEWRTTVADEDWGRYLVLVGDGKGHSAGRYATFDWPWSDGPRGEGLKGAAAVEISADRDEYEIGQRATVTVPAPAGSRLLVRLLKGGEVLDGFWKEAAGEETRLDIDLRERHAPGVYVDVLVIQPHAATRNDLPLRMTGLVHLPVVDPRRRLEPRLALPPGLEPSGTATVSVSEASGRPMSYTLALVDEGLLDLTNFATPDPWEAFNGKEALQVGLWENLGDVSGAGAGDWLSRLALGGDGFVEAPERQLQRFPPMVRFVGPRRLAAGATETLRIEMPAYLGSVRAMLLACDREAWGAAEATARVARPLMLLSSLPREFGVDEELTLPVSVFATDDGLGETVVELETGPGLRILDGARRALRLDRAGESLVRFRLATGSAPGETWTALRAVAAGDSATERQAIRLRHPGQERVDRVSGELAPGDVFETALALPGLPGTNEVELELSSLPPLDLGRRLEFLIRYPHGCLEQTVSAAFPQLLLRGLVALDSLHAARAEANVRAALARLPAFQDAQGGFRLWPGGNWIDPWAGNWAGHFLLEAERSGLRAPPGVRALWLQHQRAEASRWTAGDGGSRLGQAYRLYLLALAGEADLSSMNRLRGQTGGLREEALWLAAAYRLAGQPEAAAEQARRATDLELSGRDQWNETYGSVLRDESMRLLARSVLGDADGSGRLAAVVARRLALEGWHSTQTTAFALVALAQHYADLEGRGLRARLDAPGRGEDLVSSRPLLRVALEADTAASLPLRLGNAGESTLYYTAHLRGLRRADDFETAADGLQLTVRLLDEEGRAAGDRPLRQGERVVLEATVRNPGPDRLERLALVQPLPTGFEPDGREALESDFTGGTRGRSGELDWQDLRDDRLATYFSLAAGSSLVVRLPATASWEGRFLLTPAQVESMYHETPRATAGGRRIEVVAP